MKGGCPVTVVQRHGWAPPHCGFNSMLLEQCYNQMMLTRETCILQFDLPNGMRGYPVILSSPLSLGEGQCQQEE